MIEVPVSEIREPLLELCTYIPYFEERVGGTFKFQYWDEETGELKDMEGYEEANRQASFPDPVYDGTFQKFKDTLFREIYYKFLRLDAEEIFSRYVDTKFSDWEPQVEKLGFLLGRLLYFAVGERMCTGYTAACMKKGTYMPLLEKIKAILPEIPEDAVIVCPRRKPRNHFRTC